MSLTVSLIVGGINKQNNIVNKCLRDDWTTEMSTNELTTFIGVSGTFTGRS